jgi:pimeloyl-ACP methyl ester carboxylesterase
MEDDQIVTIFLGGFADIDRYIHDLVNRLEKNSPNAVFHFRYEFGKKQFQLKTIASMDDLAERLYTFLNKKFFIKKPNQRINIVGYSQGGMLALYTLGKYPDIRKQLNKFVSIAAPHGGALIEQFRYLIDGAFHGIKNLFSENTSLFGTIWNKAMEFGEKQLDMFGLLKHDSVFLNSEYPKTAAEVFKEIPKTRLLEIYSTKDIVATPESCGRFSDHMEIYRVNYSGHQQLPKYEKVIIKVIEFLNT